ncbi:VOC family protein [Desulfosporosinus sp. BG]|uniref:VOC family protein n=1 Tax=Desulfosporosinus sp. BG TaxID=1633135 RepID=UPI00083B6CF6|nr:VOC family protein [Desulfosporosinus sp. BG]ODA40812.1 Lactoylglutathione lyase [Desulfosporosinus sp. BG]
MGVKFNAFAIFVNDLKLMIEFYRDVLGIEIDWDGNGPHAEFRHEGIRFMMYERKELPGYLSTEVSFPKGINGTFELAIDLPNFSDVDVEFNRVIDLGVTPVVYPRNEPWGMRTSFVLDPEGNLIEIGSWGEGQKEE